MTNWKRLSLSVLLALGLLLALGVALALASPANVVVPITILHTNDFHGQIAPDAYGRGGAAHLAGAISQTRALVGAENVLLLDAGDVYFAAQPVSQLLLGESTIDLYNLMSYDAAAYGNHEFDQGQTVLISRTQQSDFPWLGANIVVSGTEWTNPWWATPYVTLTVGPAGFPVVVGVIGLDNEFVPASTIAGVTDGVVFKDLAETVLRYYDQVAAQSDVLVVLAHMGTFDNGEYEGLQAVAQALIDAGRPVDLMIAGHYHEALADPIMVGDTPIVGAGYYGRWLGQVELWVDLSLGTVTLADYSLITITTEITPDQAVADRADYWLEQVEDVVAQPVGSTYIELMREGYRDSVVGDLVTDGMLWKADELDDGLHNGSVELAFTNAGGLRADFEIPDGATLPYTITWGDTFNIMPFGNTLYLMDLTGREILDILEAAAASPAGMIQNAGIEWLYYNDCMCDTPTLSTVVAAWVNGATLDPDRSYRIVTQNYTAGTGLFSGGTNRWDTYVDMQVGVNEWIGAISPIEEADVPTGRITPLDALNRVYLPLVLRVPLP